MEIAAAQREARRSLVGGGPGVIVSGLLWLAGAITASGSANIWGPFPLPVGVAFGVSAIEIAVGFTLTLASLRKTSG